MPCELAEQPLSRSTLEDMGAPALMEIMMARSPDDICLLACSPQSPGTRDSPGAALSREGEPKMWGHMASPELPRARNGSLSRGDTWRPRSCPELGAGARAVGTHGSLRATLSREREPLS
jgi:hypothetical protein